MRRLILFAAVGLALAGCAPPNAPDVANNSTVPAPVAYQCPGNAASNATKLDESLALGVEATYKAARSAAELAVDAGLVKGPTATKLRAANKRAYDAVLVVRAAYCAGNQANYIAAAVKATEAVSAFLKASKGGQ